ncbi:MAG: type I-C CRISPR-associated endonuclease Cas1c [Clostridia bacterium]|nr:type I-C CRISPR-associated endonuclease Cas1c [Clostridia bacterium]
MKKLLNVLYVLTEESYISKQGETICIKVGGVEKVRIPAHTLESIICFGNATVSTPLIAFCGERGISLSFIGKYGKFQGRIEGPISGNVLLRRAQHFATEDYETQLKIAKLIVCAKIANSRNIILRNYREMELEKEKQDINRVIKMLATIANQVRNKDNLDEIRGLEGFAAREYFKVFNFWIKSNKEHFYFIERNKRPPKDNMNSIMSFLYMLLANDMRTALEGVGLDPARGFLHALRPGRPSLALDLMEELRAPLCDRLALSLVNLRQLAPTHFKRDILGVKISDEGKQIILKAWQKRKKEKITHPYLSEKVEIGLIPHCQALLMARYLRGDIDSYPPFYWR